MVLVARGKKENCVRSQYSSFFFQAFKNIVQYCITIKEKITLLVATLSHKYLIWKFVLCSHKRTIGRRENYGSVSCVRFGVGFSASLCCIKVIQIHVRPSNPSMLSIKINISFYKNMFQHIFVPVMFKHVLCNCQKRYYWCKHLCIILKYKNLNIWLYCFFCL